MMIIKHELRSYKKSFILWTTCLIAFDFLMILLFPSLQDTLATVGESYANMGAFGDAFGMDQLNIGTIMGFYGTYIGVMLSLCGAMFASFLGTGLLAKEEAGHTAEYLFTLPYSKTRIVLQKIVAVITLLLLFDLLNFLFGILGLQIIGTDYSMKQIALFHIAQFFMHLEVVAIGILISACTRKVNIGGGLGIALLLYFMDMMSRVLDQLENLKFITPYYYANAAEVFTSSSIDMPLLCISILVTMSCMIASVFIINKRDLYA